MISLEEGAEDGEDQDGEDRDDDARARRTVSLCPSYEVGKRKRKMRERIVWVRWMGRQAERQLGAERGSGGDGVNA